MPKQAIRNWGDQGDGTYRNPVLNGDFPDSDIERCGEWWYLITSTFHTLPGMTILRSKDLVNWEYLANAMEGLDYGPEYHWSSMGGYGQGVWAGDLVFHEGRWYIYQSDFKHGLTVSRTEGSDIAGKWSPPVVILPGELTDDPGVYFDPRTKKGYLVLSHHEAHGFAQCALKLYELSWDGMRVTSEGVEKYRGNGSEAAKIYFIDDRFYIAVSEWVEESRVGRDRKQLFFRTPADDIFAPWERKVVLEKESPSDRSASQGALVRMDDGSWWYMHQLVQLRVPGNPSIAYSYEGRPQCLEPVAWIDGWPIPGALDRDAGIGVPVRRYRMPATDGPKLQLQNSDEFDGGILQPQWQWNHSPRAGRYSLSERNGFFRLYASKPVGSGGFRNAANTLSQRTLGLAPSTATMAMDLGSLADGDRAGMCDFAAHAYLIGVKKTGGRLQLYTEADGKECLWETFDGSTIFLRSLIADGFVQLAYSKDGEDFNPLGERGELIFGDWRGNRIGFYCYNDDNDNAQGYADIDWFRYDHG